MNSNLGLFPRALFVLAAFPVAAVAAVAVGAQDPAPVRKPEQTAVAAPPPAIGEVVPATGPSVIYVHQSANGDYWFGSNDAGVYRFDGKTLVQFTMNDGLVSNRIRGIDEDAKGNLYFTSYEGISRFDGRAFTTLPVAVGSKSDWKLEPEDLWFVGPPDAGIVYRFDGESLPALAFPSTPLGDRHFREMPRDKFPNAIYNPYDVYFILRDSRGNVWFCTTCVGVARFDGKGFRWATDRILTIAPVRSVIEDKTGNYWFTFSGSGTVDGFRPVEGFSEVQGGAKGTIVDGMTVIESDDGDVWTGNLAGIVLRFRGEHATEYRVHDGETPIQVFAMYKDRKGIVWLGTHNGGAYRFNGKVFEKFVP